MKGSLKANLLVFLIIAVTAFCISCAFASYTIHPNNESYKLIPLEDDSFEPNYIYEVPTITPKNTTNETNSTNTTDDTITYNETIETWNESYDDWEEILEDD